MLLAIEICMATIAIALAHIAPEIGAHWFEKWERRLGNLARRRALTVLSVGLLALTIRSALLPILPIPEPSIHDEFSHLLLADTLAHGRMLIPFTPCGFISKPFMSTRSLLTPPCTIPAKVYFWPPAKSSADIPSGGCG